MPTFHDLHGFLVVSIGWENSSFGRKKMIKFPWKIVMNLSSIRPFFSFLHVNTLLANGRRQKSGGFWVVSTTKSKSRMKILK